jgi:hypothetical protein
VREFCHDRTGNPCIFCAAIDGALRLRRFPADHGAARRLLDPALQ